MATKEVLVDSGGTNGVAGGKEPKRYLKKFSRDDINPDVDKLLRRLARNGHEAYLVGGCVRDLLLRREPKDFDVATSAHPEEVRELFRNSRIIGRRFRLVHVMFSRRLVIEVATFRRNPSPGETGELIRNDNVFGEAHEDALRRDFTINGLFYDVENGHILDWVGGMPDVKRRVVRTIGNPDVRFREDPVRILRAIKFSGRCDLGISADTYDAMVACRDTLTQSAPPRVAEEILRLLRGGEARRSIYIAWEMGILDVLLPELAAMLYDADGDDTAGARIWRQLSHIDRAHAAGRPLDDTVLWTLLLLEPLKEACEGQRDRGRAVAEYLDLLGKRIVITRRVADGVRRIVTALPRLRAGKPGRMVRSEIFASALEVFEADAAGGGDDDARHRELLDKYRSEVEPPRKRRGRRR